MSARADAEAKLRTRALKYYKAQPGRVTIADVAHQCSIKPALVRVWLKEFRRDFPKKPAKESLTDQEQAFCQEYLRTFSPVTAAAKVGYDKAQGHTLLARLAINKYITDLKRQRAQRAHLSGDDIIQQYIKIAFADVTDFFGVTDDGILRFTDQADTAVLQSLSQDSSGMISIKLHDKLKALDKLDKFYGAIPEWRERIEERKVELMEAAQEHPVDGADGATIIDDIPPTDMPPTDMPEDLEIPEVTNDAAD